jgi:hypothetical protein
LKTPIKALTTVLAVMLCMAAFVVPAAAGADEPAYDTFVESCVPAPTATPEMLPVSTEPVEADQAQAGEPLTPAGNLTLVDDIAQGDETDGIVEAKQFITVQSKNGNYFYLIIDRSGDEENVHFLNQVDEADLLALLEDGTEDETEEVATCTCADKCVIGAINTACDICRSSVSDCTGQQVLVEVEPETTEEPEPEVAPEETKKSGSGAALLLFLLLAAAIGGAVFWLKFRKTRPTTTGEDDLDDYNYGQEDEDDEETEIDDADLMEEAEQEDDE